MSPKRLLAALLGLLFLLPLPAPLLAQGTSINLGVQDFDSSQPVEITSENLALDQQSGQAEFTGNVIVGQGDLVMTCERLLVEYGPGADGANAIKTIRMFGGVTFVGPAEAAESQEAVYTLENETIVMTGNVLLTQGTTALSADRMTYNLQSGAGRMEGRVKTILQPGNN